MKRKDLLDAIPAENWYMAKKFVDHYEAKFVEIKKCLAITKMRDLEHLEIEEAYNIACAASEDLY